MHPVILDHPVGGGWNSVENGERGCWERARGVAESEGRRYREGRETRFCAGRNARRQMRNISR